METTNDLDRSSRDAAPTGGATVGPACPECGQAVDLDRTPRIGEIVVCAGCSAELEVIETGPVTLALAPEIEEDWGE